MSQSSTSVNNIRWEEVQQRFNTLSRAMQRSKFTETELLSKCRELKGALVEKAHQLQLAQATKLEDEHTIQALRAEMQKAVAKTDNSYTREQAARQLVTDLQSEIENLRAKLAAEASNREKELDTYTGGALSSNGGAGPQGMFSDSIGGNFTTNKSSLRQSPFEVQINKITKLILQLFVFVFFYCEKVLFVFTNPLFKILYNTRNRNGRKPNSTKHSHEVQCASFDDDFEGLGFAWRSLQCALLCMLFDIVCLISFPLSLGVQWVLFIFVLIGRIKIFECIQSAHGIRHGQYPDLKLLFDSNFLLLTSNSNFNSNL